MTRRLVTDKDAAFLRHVWRGSNALRVNDFLDTREALIEALDGVVGNEYEFHGYPGKFMSKVDVARSLLAELRTPEEPPDPDALNALRATLTVDPNPPIVPHVTPEEPQEAP